MNKKVVSYSFIYIHILQTIFIPYSYASSNENEPQPQFESSETMEHIAKTLSSSGNEGEISEVIKQEAVNIINSNAEKYITKETERWLSQYGTVNIDVEMDQFLALKSGEIDLLVPFFSKGNGKISSTWFIQPGMLFNQASNFDGRDFVHIGLGYRKKDVDSFFGMNAFYDYDLTREHQRGSVGGEYGRQYFKLTSNYYFPLNGWKESPNRFNSIGNGVLLDERPAQGVDFNFTGYLPQIPWISLETTFQQFFGENVEMSNGNTPMANPFVVSGALNFQPVSLLSLKTGYTLEKGGKEEATIGLGLSYHLGIPLNKQLSMSNVADTKALEFQLLSLVERDHNIRLEYRQATTPVEISFKTNSVEIEELSTAALSEWLEITGDQSQVKNILFSGEAQSYIQNNTHFIAPEFIPAGENSYSLNAVLHLKNGQIKTVPAPINILIKENRVSSSINDRDISIHSVGDTNNKTGQVGEEGAENVGVLISVVVRNTSGRPLAGKKVNFLNKTSTASFSATETLTSQEGKAITTLYSTKTGTVPFTVLLDEEPYQEDASFDALKSPPSETESTLRPFNSVIAADGITETAVTVELKDQYRNPLLNKTVVFELFSGDVPVAPSTGITIGETFEEANGAYTTKLRGTATGRFTIKAKVAGPPAFEIASDITLSAATAIPSTVYSKISSTLPSIPANGTAETTLKLDLRDQFQNKLKDRNIHFSAYSGGTILSEGITFGPTLEEEGTYTTTIKGTKAGKLTIKPNLVGIGSFEVPLSFELTIPENIAPSDQKSTLRILKETVIANGSDSTTLILQLKDEFGNTLSGLEKDIEFKAFQESNDVTESLGIKLGPITVHKDGYYFATLRGTRAGTIDIKPLIKNIPLNLKSTITLTTDGLLPSIAQSTLSASNASIEADNQAESLFTLALKDKNGNSLLKREVLFKASRDGIDFSNGMGITLGDVTESLDGTYLMSVKGRSPGPLLIKAVVLGVSGFEKTAEMNLTLISAQPDQNNSTAVSDKISIEANGTDSASMIVNLFDAFKNPLPGKTLGYEIFDSAGQPITGDPGITLTPEESTTGTYIARIKGTRAGGITIKATVNGNSTFGLTTQLALTTNNAVPDRAKSEFTPGKTVVTADNTDHALLTLKLKDKYGNPLSNKQASFTAFRDNVQLTTDIELYDITAEENGVYNVKIKGVAAGRIIVKANIVGVSNFSMDSELTFTSDNIPSSDRSIFDSSKSNITADDRDTSVLTLTLKDKHGNPILNQNVKFTAVIQGTTTPATGLTFTHAQPGSNNIYVGTVKGQKAGTYTIKANVDGTADAVFGPTKTLTISSDGMPPNKEKSTLAPTKGSILANGTDENIFTFTVKDQFENGLSGKSVEFQLFEGTKDVTFDRDFSFNRVSNGTQPGQYRVSLTATRAATLKVIAIVTGTPSFQKEIETSVISVSPPPAYSAYQYQASTKTKEKEEFAEKGTLPGPFNFQATITAKNKFSTPYKIIQDHQERQNQGYLEEDNQPSTAQPWAKTSKLLASNLRIQADNMDSSVITLLLKDEFGNPITGGNVIFSVYIHDAQVLSGITISQYSEGKNGSYNAILKGTIVGPVTVKARVHGVKLFEASTTLELI